MKSFVSMAVGKHCHDNHYRPQGTGIPIRLANGTETSVEDWYNIPVEVGRVRAVQQFGVMPDLTVDVLIGVDIMAQLGIGIPPPPKKSKIYTTMCTINCEGEADILGRFLATELPKFESSCGPTDLAEHKIRLKTNLPIKQRYRPRNPAMQKIGWPPFGHESIGHEPLTTLEQWKASRHRSLWLVKRDAPKKSLTMKSARWNTPG